MLDGQYGEMSVRHEIPLHSRLCKKIAKQVGVTHGWMRYPCRLASKPSADLPPRFGNSRRALEHAGVEFIDAEKGGPGVRLRLPPR